MIEENQKFIQSTFEMLKHDIEKFEHELDLTKAPQNLLTAKKIEE